MTDDARADRDFAQAVAAKNALNGELAATGWLAFLEGNRARYRFMAVRSLATCPDVTAGVTELQASTADELRDIIRDATALDRRSEDHAAHESS